MPKVIQIKCPSCKAVVNHVTQPDTWPKDKVSTGNTICPKCRTRLSYEIVGGKCTSWKN